MSGLILKDFLNLKKTVLPMALFLGLYFVIAVVTKNSGIFSGVIMIFSAMLPISAVSYDERAGFTKYALTMPLSRSALVISKYLMALILLGISSILCVLSNILIGGISLQEIFFSVGTLFLMGLFVFSVSLPAVFKFGTEKGRIVMVGICMLGAALIAISAFGITAIPSGDTNFNVGFSGMPLASSLENLLNSNFLIILICLVAVVIFSISLAVSLRIYKNKDF